MRIICFFLILYNVSFGQLKVNYYKVQNKFGASVIDKTFIQKKIISDSEDVIFEFAKKDSILLNVRFSSNIGYTDTQFEELKKEYIQDFEPTKIKGWENLYVYYDEKKNIMIVQDFADSTRKILTNISFLTLNETIKGFVAIFENGH